MVSIKKEIIAMVLCILMLLVVFSSGCVEEEKKVGENTTNLEQMLSAQESNYTTLKNKYGDVSDVVHVVYLLLILITIIVFFGALLWYRRVRKPFREIASDLGLDYKKGFPLSSTPVEVTGSYRGRSLNIYVEVRGSRRYAETSTTIEISHSGNLKEEVYIFRKGSEWLVKTKYKSGIPEFDNKFRVKGDENIVGNILDFFIIQKILDLKKIDFIKVKPRHITLKRWSSLVDKEYLIKGIDIVVDLAERVEKISKR